MDRKICLTHKNMPPKVRVDIPHPLAQIFWYLSLSKELCSRKLKRMQNINIYVETEPSKYVLIRWEFIYSLDVVKGFSNSRISFQHTTAPLRMSKACDKIQRETKNTKSLFMTSFMDPDAITTYQAQSSMKHETLRHCATWCVKKIQHGSSSLFLVLIFIRFSFYFAPSSFAYRKKKLLPKPRQERARTTVNFWTWNIVRHFVYSFLPKLKTTRKSSKKSCASTSLQCQNRVILDVLSSYILTFPYRSTVNDWMGDELRLASGKNFLWIFISEQ